MTQVTKQTFPLLMRISSPADLKQLELSELPTLASEIREYMLQSIDKCGGHFGASMGAVELTIALHYVFDTPEDRLVWDVGHQAYIHKILTGRRDRLNTIKQPGGLSPFCKRGESEYDAFGVGHSSTSVSAITGMAAAGTLDKAARRHIAVIGDGGLTGGMAFEALNHAGDLDPDMLVILNDNDMSISENVGALNNYLARLLAGKTYSTLREQTKKVLAKLPEQIARFAKRTETHLKGMITPGTIFEELGFHYVGPIDGHDVLSLVDVLKTIKPLKGAQFLHVITTKGKGYEPAEKEQIKYHAVKPGFHSNETPTAPKKAAPTYSNIFGQWLLDMAAEDKNLIGVTPAMREGSDLIAFSKAYPERYFDVGIAEQHAVTFAAGIATEGKKAVVAIYSTFLQRAYDQLIHDVALQNLDVTFAIDRAGLVGADGPTHAGSFDLSYLRCIPNMIIMAPSNENECRQMLYTGYQHNGPAAIRYPRGTGPGVTPEKQMSAIPIGKGEVVRRGNDIAILAFGSRVTPAVAAGDTLNATVANMRFVKPIDKALVLKLAETHTHLITVEENAVMGGAGSAVLEVLAEHGMTRPVLQLGLPDRYLEHGDYNQMLKDCDLDAEGIINSIKKSRNFNEVALLQGCDLHG